MRQNDPLLSQKCNGQVQPTEHDQQHTEPKFFSNEADDVAADPML